MSKFDIDTIRPIKLKRSITLFKNDSLDFFKSRESVIDSLSEAILEGDKKAFHEILGGLLNVINKEELSRRSKVPIATIRRMAAGSNFNVDSMLKVTSAISKELVA